MSALPLAGCPTGPALSSLPPEGQGGRTMASAQRAEHAARAARAASGFSERNPRRTRILNSQFKTLPECSFFQSRTSRIRTTTSGPSLGAGGAEQRWQRRLGDGMPFRICLADSSDGTPRSREDFLFPPPCGSGRPHAGAGAGASATIPQCQSSHEPAMFWQIRSPGRRRDVVDR